MITFLDWSDFRHWPQWIGLLLSIVIAVVAFKRAKDEGVEMPKMPQGVSVSRGGRRRCAAAPRRLRRRPPRLRRAGAAGRRAASPEPQA